MYRPLESMLRFIAAFTCLLTLSFFCLVPAHGAAGGIDTDTGRIFPVTTPIPMSASIPVSPEELTDSNSNVFSMTGQWNFSITRGQTINGIYVSTDDLNRFLSASSTTGGTGYWNGGALNAIDGDIGTHWTASDSSGPQWLKLDLGKVQTVSGMSLDFGDKRILAGYIIDGSVDGQSWTTLSDQSADQAANQNGGDLLFKSSNIRFLRITIQKMTRASRNPADLPRPIPAQIAEVEVTVTRDGVPTVWEPAESQDGFESPTFKDTAWASVMVPSNWEIAGFSKPTYNDVDDAVGEYRRSVMIPKSFAGSNIYWRFDGVFDGAEIYVNGVKAGYHESGYTAFDVDVTDLVRPGEINVFALRAAKKTSSVDLDTGDYEAMGGIYRETFLYKTPTTHFRDITVRTDVDAPHGSAVVSASLAVVGPTKKGEIVDAKLIDSSGATVGEPVFQTLTGQPSDGQETLGFNIPVVHPKLWSAEKPNLYTLVVVLDSFDASGKETIEQPVGIRQISISPTAILLWNGQPIKLAGTARHDIWPNKGTALSDVEWKHDVELIKEANINSVRTSHYNDARRFLDVCEQHGLYILDEVPYCWVNEKVNDPRYQDAFIQRARETFARDKNRPEVLAWSCGNENGPGVNTSAVDKYMHDHDPTRPAFSSQLYGNIPGQSFTDAHYPTPKDVAGVNAKGIGPAPVIYTEQPHMFSAVQNLDWDPSLHDYWGVVFKRSWDAVAANPQICGSYIWEWQNQPIVSNWSDTTPNHLGPSTTWFENYKGIVDGYRTPKPEYWNVRETYSPIQIEARTIHPTTSTSSQSTTALVEVQNRYSFTNLSELACTWSALNSGIAIGSGTVVMSGAPLSNSNLVVPVPKQATDIRLVFAKPGQKYYIYSALLHVVGAKTPAPAAPAKSGGNLWLQDQGTQYDISNNAETIDISKASGQITRWTLGSQPVLFVGPTLTLGQSHQVVDQYGQSSKTFVNADTYLAAPNPSIQVKQTKDEVTVNEVVTLNDKSGAAIGTESISYLITPDNQIGITWSLGWLGADTRAWEAGISVWPAPIDTNMSWYKDSILADYQPNSMGAISGNSVLQNGSKHGVHWLALSDKSKHGVAIISNGESLITRIESSYSPVVNVDEAEAVDCELSTPWIADQDVKLSKDKPISGSFILRAF